MLQLRNRYNLEKRRMEQLRDEVPGKYHESPWPLYESLQFLSDHIKSRRRYKSMLPVVNFKEDAEINESGNDYSAMGADDSAMVGDGKDDDSQMGGGGGGDDGDVSVHPFANGLLTVKVEDNSEDQESEVET